MSLISSSESVIFFEWQAPYNGGSLITYYKIYWDSGIAGSNYELYAFTVGPDNNFLVNYGLNEGQTYSFIVAAVNFAGDSPLSLPTSFIAASVPGQPGVPFYTSRSVA